MRVLFGEIPGGRGDVRAIEFLGIAALAAFVIWCIYFAIRSAKARGRHTSQRSPHPPGPQYEFPPPPLASALEPIAPTDDSGTFLVKGVDRKSGRDSSEYVEAESPANARAKAELSGIVVTAVERAS